MCNLGREWLDTFVNDCTNGFIGNASPPAGGARNKGVDPDSTKHPTYQSEHQPPDLAMCTHQMRADKSLVGSA